MAETPGDSHPIEGTLTAQVMIQCHKIDLPYKISYPRVNRILEILDSTSF